MPQRTGVNLGVGGEMGEDPSRLEILTGPHTGGVDVPWELELVRPALILLAGRWVVPVLAALYRGALRRAVLRDELRGVSDKILTDTLRRMETSGLVIRSVVPSVPIEVDYALTEYGQSLWPVLSVIHNWAANSPNQPSLQA